MTGQGHRESDRKVRFARDAELPADQPRAVDLESHRLAGQEIGRNLDSYRKEDVVVGVCLETAGLVIEARYGPLDRTGGEAGWKRPYSRRGNAGVSGVLPVGVPARLGSESNGNGDGRARNDGVNCGDQLRSDKLLPFVKLGIGQDRQNKGGEEDWDLPKDSHRNSLYCNGDSGDEAARRLRSHA